MKSLKIQILVLMLFISGISQAQWLKTNGPNGGYVTDFAVKGSSIFAATGTIGGIFRSDDDGFTWVTVKNGLPDSYGDPSTIVVKGNLVFAGGFSLGLFRSSDNGNSWVNISNNIAISFITELHVHNDILFAGTYGAGVYRSTDNGNSFQAVNNGFGAFAYISTFASSGNLLFTGLTGNGGTVGVYVSGNEGNSWTQVINGLPTNRLSTQSLTVSGTDVYAAVNDQGVYKSTNNGGSWFAVNTGIPIIINGGVNVVEAEGGIIYAGMNAGDGAYKSTNNGDSWVRITNGLPITPTTLSFLIRDTYVLIGTQYAVHRSSDKGSSWFASYKGIANTVVTDLITFGNSIYASTMPGNNGYGEGVSVTPDNGDNWSAAGFPANISVNTIAFNGTTMFAGAINAIYKSTNFGTNWQKVDSTNLGAGIEKIIVVNNTIFAATYGMGIKKSIDNGTTWQFSNNGLGNNVTVYDLMVDGSSIYAGIFWGVYVSTNNGASWVNKSGGIYPGSSVYSLGKSGNNLLAGSHRGLYLSSNNGSSWGEIPSAGPLNSNIHGFAASGNHVYAAADSGVFKSSNNGLAWTPFNEGLSNYTEVMSITILDNYIYIGTDGRGVWKQSLSGILTLNLKALIEGFYDPITNKMVKDTVSVYLRNVSSPFAIVDSARAVLDSTGNGNFTFSNAVNSVPYYIVIKHRSGLETWSASGNSFTSGQLSYDFTTSASQAYGNNLALKGSKYTIYSGDINQDGIIDAGDVSLVDNDAFNSVSGYVLTDVNGDNFVDATDLSIVDNNVYNGVILMRP